MEYSFKMLSEYIFWRGIAHEESISENKAVAVNGGTATGRVNNAGSRGKGADRHSKNRPDSGKLCD
jgi:hypothetical protein